LKSQEEILLNFKPRNYSKFPFEVHFESGEVPMEKAVSFFKTFTNIFYFDFLSSGRSFLDGSKLETI
jgi:hypothetical protein